MRDWQSRIVFGLVVDDKEAARQNLQEAGVDVQASGSVAFHDPWGNHVQVVEYSEIQFSKTEDVLLGMGLGDLEKGEQALRELRSKGLAPDELCLDGPDVREPDHR